MQLGNEAIVYLESISRPVYCATTLGTKSEATLVLVDRGSSPHLAGPDVKGSVKREKLLYREMWEVFLGHFNHLRNMEVRQLNHGRPSHYNVSPH